jgi:HK97 gp10 family phage protein
MATKVTGVKELVLSYKKAGKDIEKQCAYIVSANALQGRNEAVRNAPIAFGKLRQSIGIEVSYDKLEQSVVANADYAPYIEFGTGGKVSVPSEWSQLANNFRGQNFSNDDILQRLREWCRLKGINEKYAYPIMVTIFREGMRPQPFMYPAWQKVKKQFSRDMINFMKNG